MILENVLFDCWVKTTNLAASERLSDVVQKNSACFTKLLVTSVHERKSFKLCGQPTTLG